MAKGPIVRGLLIDPMPSSWWKLHRHQVLLVVGVLVGFYLCSHTSDAAPADSPRPAHTVPAAPTSRPHSAPTAQR
ncbi:hypothetical protein [Streptomyces sp. NPDC050738]|uniref:hypothetical protein n=1 Tax=Streptomyces sp. NPDC050738 TaxID=3154744 RepID=UPI00343DE648